MVSENLKDWIKQKREAGVSDERIKKSLEKTGHDPSVVDEIENPFDADSSATEPSEDLFESNDSGSQEKSDLANSSRKSSSRENTERRHKQGTTDSRDKSGFGSTSSSRTSASNNSGRSLPSLPSAPDVSKKTVGIIGVLVLLIAGGFGVYRFMPSDLNTDFDPNIVLNSDIDSSTSMTKLAQLDEKYSGCPNSGVRVQSVSSSDGVTTANVLVTRNEAWVVLEVMKDGGVVGFSTENMVGEAKIRVEAVGDQVRLRPLGCEKFSSERSY